MSKNVENVAKVDGVVSDAMREALRKAMAAIADGEVDQYDELAAVALKTNDVDAQIDCALRVVWKRVRNVLQVRERSKAWRNANVDAVKSLTAQIEALKAQIASQTAKA